MKKRIAAVAAAIVSAAALTVSASAYNGYIQFQNTAYSFRNDWNEGSYGKDANNDAFDNVIVWGNNDPETYPEYEDYFDYDIGGYLLPVTYTDVEITGNGTYTVAVDGFDWALDGQSAFYAAGLSTDIPVSEGAYISSASLIVDGVKTLTRDNLTPDDMEQNVDYLVYRLINTYNPDLEKYTGAYPTSSLAVEFTIAGLGGGAEEAPAEETVVEEPAAGDVQAATVSSKGSPDTGIEDVAVVAGLAILAGAGIVVTRRRK